MSQGDIQKYLRLRGYQFHSQTVQAIINSYFDALKSFFRVKKSNPDAKPPKRRPKCFKVRWIQNSISFSNGVLRLSNGKGREPITLNALRSPCLSRCASAEAVGNNDRYSLLFTGVQNRTARKRVNGQNHCRGHGGDSPDCLTRRCEHHHLQWSVSMVVETLS